jgi:hypothetical protein
MNWILALGVVGLVVFLIMRRRPKTIEPQRPAARPAAADRRLQDLKRLEGALCIYEQGATVQKARLLQVQESGPNVMLALQVLRAEGLSDVKEEQLHLEAPWSGLEYSTKLVCAPYLHWKLFLDKTLTQKVLDLGLAATDLKAIKRAILEHQMK